MSFGSMEQAPQSPEPWGTGPSRTLVPEEGQADALPGFASRGQQCYRRCRNLSCPLGWGTSNQLTGKPGLRVNLSERDSEAETRTGSVVPFHFSLSTSTQGTPAVSSVL